MYQKGLFNNKSKTTKTLGFCRFRNRKRISKKGSMELSIGAIVILIIAITFLSLGLVFMKSMLGKMFSRFEEQISQEPEPPKPSLSYPVTLSRNPVKTKEAEVEAIKLSLLNPSQEGWLNRQFIRTKDLCGKVDGICFIDVEDTTETCDTKSNAKKNDNDCSTGMFTGMDCTDNSEKSPCLMSNAPELYCPGYTVDNLDPDCQPKEGVEIYMTCDEKIMEKPFRRNIGPINKANFKTSILLLRLKSKIPNDQYLCQIKIFAEDKEFFEDLVVQIENE